MEASGQARWFERLLAELQMELWIGDASEIRAKRVRKKKTDREDARHILRLLVEDRFPRIWVPNAGRIFRLSPYLTKKMGIGGVGWHTFRHTVGTVLAELGEHQLTIRDYLRHSSLGVTNQYLQAASKTKREARAKLVEAILPVHLLLGKTAETVAP